MSFLRLIVYQIQEAIISHSYRVESHSCEIFISEHTRFYERLLKQLMISGTSKDLPAFVPKWFLLENRSGK